MIEIKLGESLVDEAAHHLCEIEKLVKKFNVNKQEVPHSNQDNLLMDTSIGGG